MHNGIKIAIIVGILIALFAVMYNVNEGIITEKIVDEGQVSNHYYFIIDGNTIEVTQETYNAYEIGDTYNYLWKEVGAVIV